MPQNRSGFDQIPTLLDLFRQGLRQLAHVRITAFLLSCVIGLNLNADHHQDIVNTAQLDYRVGGAPIQTSSSADLSSRVADRTPSTITFYHYAPNFADALNFDIQTTSYRNGDPDHLRPIDPPRNLGSGEIDWTAVPLVEARAFRAGQPIFLTLEDLDQNLLSDYRESVLITLTVPLTGDQEIIRLVETGPDTGLFAGYIQSAVDSGVPFNGLLSLDTDSRIIATYIDPVDGSDTSNDAALVDPFGLVFDSSTGLPINGVTVSIYNNDTGLLADVFGDDGISTYPSTLVTGTTVEDSGGAQYDLPDGGFRFPLLAAGNYHLEVTPPNGYSFPSTVADSDIQLLPNAPFTIVTGSRGDTFPLIPGPPLEIDLPIDPLPAEQPELFLQKSAADERVAIGDFLRYDLTLENTGEGLARNISVNDVLPYGFRYEEGSAYLGNQKISDPRIEEDGRTLLFNALGSLEPETSVDLRYVVEVTPAAPLGRATNRAVLSDDQGSTSNEARAAVTVIDDLQGENILMGRVMIRPSDSSLWTPNDATIGLPGLEGARIYLEDGRYVITDQDGRFHFEGIREGTHVVQLDTLSVPEKYDIVGQDNTRFAGRSYSQFVDLQAGAMWRTDFFVSEKQLRTGTLQATLRNASSAETAAVGLNIENDLLNISRLRAIMMLPEGTRPQVDSIQFNEREIAASLRGRTLTFDLGEIGPETSEEFLVPLSVSSDEATPIKVLLFADTAEEKNIRSEPFSIKISNTVVEENSSITISREIAWKDSPRINASARSMTATETEHDASWLSNASSQFEWVEPSSTFVPAIPSISLGVKYAAGHTVQLYNKGEPVSGLNIKETIHGANGQSSLRRWRGVNLIEGDNLIEAVLVDAAGNELERIQRSFHFGGVPVNAEYLEDASILIADGRTNPAIAIRLTDIEGNPVRPGMRGRYRVDPPYEALSPEERTNRFLEVGERDRQIEYEVGEDGVALLYLEPTTRSGEVDVHLSLNDRDFDFQAWLKPSARDWILVGLATGTVGYNEISSKLEEAPEGGIEENYYEDGRLAFFAKGRVKGEWLLTTAYDSEKESEVRGQESLHQVIDPDTYYTLYGDQTEQGYEAASAKKLFVKIEREKFYAMFGDFDTGLTVTELSRYSRNLTGFKSEYSGKNFTFNGFVSENEFTYARDEIQGDGTSGLYRLSQENIVINSETIRLQTRDRFQSQIIVEEIELSRHLDYNINYDDSTIYFKSPVFSRDENLNPVFIVAEYEVEDAGKDSYTYGARASVKTEDDSLELGVTHVHEESSESEGDLVGADFRWQIDQSHELRAEIAHTDVEGIGDSSSDSDGNAYLVEIEHNSPHKQGALYFRQQDAGFGLGQQNASETGTRKYGASAGYEIDRDLSANAEIYRDEVLGTGDTRHYFGAYLERRFEDTDVRLGYIWSEDDVSGSGKFTSSQVHTGLSRRLFQDKVAFRVDHYQSLGDEDESSDYPTRTILGADYLINEKVRLFTEYEIAFGDEENSENARAGLSLLPWTGASIDTAVQQEINEDGGRTYANFGLAQIYQMNSNWSFSGGLDSGRNFSESQGGARNFNGNTPSASGSSEDFTALSLGTTYLQKTWSWNARAEQRYADLDDRWNLYSGIIGEVDKGLHMALQSSLFQTDSKIGDDTLDAEIRYSIAYRPLDSEWIWLNKLELLYDSISGTDSLKNARVVNMGDANYLPHEDLQIAFQYGMKYVLTDIEGDEFSGFTDFYGIEMRYDIHERIDLGLRGAVRHSWNSNIIDFSFGPSVGFNPAENMWVSLGYNLDGYHDEDFSRSDYTAQGAYIQFRVKFDQDTLKDIGSLLKHER